MSDVGQPERRAQDRVVELLRERLGYDHLGSRQHVEGNSNVEVDLLAANLRARGVADELATRAIEQFVTAARLGAGEGLYEASRRVYGLVRYGVDVKVAAGEQHRKVWLIDWQDPGANDFQVAEEVTIDGVHGKRPDVVLYANGIALATIELKRSKISVGEGIRQTIGNQSAHFIRPFFTTVQLVFAGNDVEGLRYGTIETPEKYWLRWKEPSEEPNPLDRDLLLMCEPERLLELVHDFTVFDAGVRKTCRHNQYFGVKRAQERIARREGGVIWHTQGSGKSLTMVWLAKWIREHQPDARVLLVTDRTELDEQIERVFNGVDEEVHRTTSGTDLVATLDRSAPWLVCSLVHKFGAGDGGEGSGRFVPELGARIPTHFTAKGNVFVFVDEAHRTQSGELHSAMKQLLPGAMFIGFTGTPLLKADKATSIETFGSFIHTYRFDEAVADGVVLDLRYEARNIDQHLDDPVKVDQWFDAKTRNMTELPKAELKRRWATMQKVVSAEPRARRIVQDVLLDMETRPRLMDGRGNAMLVGSSIHQACTFYELFVNSGFRGKCAIVTSYAPRATDVSKEDLGAGRTEKLRQYDIYRRMLADHFGVDEDTAMGRVDQFEHDVKRRFVEAPGQMRLLIVVDKLLTGFDAPSATYLYIDKAMRDHGLFQAICRVNRLDGHDKDYGYVVDYRDLFNSLRTAIHDYTSDAFDGYGLDDVQGLLENRIEKAGEDLDAALETIRALCEPVPPPRGTLQYQHHFCTTEPGDAEQLRANEQRRVALYKAVAALTRAYANIANDMRSAGYGEGDAEAVRAEVAHYLDVRAEVKLGAGEDVDFKQHEAGMRALLDNYIGASPSETVANFGDTTLVQLICDLGHGAIDHLPEGIRDDRDAVAETIANNVRAVIVEERALNPRYYDTMSRVLDALIAERRTEAVRYQEFLAELIELARKVGRGESDVEYPAWADSGEKRALFDFFDGDLERATATDSVVREVQARLLDRPSDEGAQVAAGSASRAP